MSFLSLRRDMRRMSCAHERMNGKSGYNVYGVYGSVGQPTASKPEVPGSTPRSSGFLL